MSIQKSLIEKFQELLGAEGLFGELSVTFDRTPYFNESESIIIHDETKDWNIIDILVHCGLYEEN